MKHNWLLIIEAQSLSPSSRFYKVIAGTGKQALADLAFLKEYADRNNCFWHRWDNDAADFLMQVLESLHCNMIQLNVHHITARSLVSFIKETGDAPKKPFLTPQQVRIGSMLMPKSKFLHPLNVIRQAEAEQRKKPKAHNIGTTGFY